ncbi:UDP-N-acetylglucosamine 4-epimerase [Novosphingobium sp. PhB57]|uniref:SDR family oxidoreductase n=1 Tax=Novosphingobium sp. PhB57 TaxID=2485107 RepID=UPI001044B6D5|nr:SDR family oxidoreductase [Novosphingobium sp. PhB57]TCU59815.1 UDP-N-acetylglucosamine 4-epimerase [Novosphingobium sp. PhB57]
MSYWFDHESQKILKKLITSKRRTWLVTGVAGFIGSNIAESLLHLGQKVIGFDNFSTGHPRNIEDIVAKTAAADGAFTFLEGDIRDRDACADIMDGVEIVLHQAALGSVPRSIEDPRTSHDVNVTGFINILDEARRRNVENFVYAASSSTYGDEPNLPKIEERIGRPLSPYAGTKLFDEIYAEIFSRTYGFGSIGLRYFNVFGPRQDPNGAYAAVIPKWTDRIIANKPVTINGDGLTSRDFCFIDNAVQANLRAGIAQNKKQSEVFNVAVGEQTSLNELFALIKERLALHQCYYDKDAMYAEFRRGDVRHSLASIDRAAALLGYHPTHTIGEGIGVAIPWYLAQTVKA